MQVKWVQNANLNIFLPLFLAFSSKVRPLYLYSSKKGTFYCAPLIEGGRERERIVWCVFSCVCVYLCVCVYECMNVVFM